MNILQLISSSEGYYGAEHVCVTLSAELQELGATSVVGAFRNCHKAIHLEVLDQAKQCGLKTEEINCRGRLDWNAVVELREIIERHKIDIIHCHNIKPSLYSFFAARDRDVGLVRTCHTWHVTSLASWVLSLLDRCILRGSDRVVLVSEHMLPQVRRFGLQAIVIHNGLDLKSFSNIASELRQEMDWCGRTIIASVCRLTPEKGLRNLLRAAASVLQRYPRALFVFAGDGPDRQSLEAEAITLGIQDSVRFLGFREDIPELLSCVDLLTIASVSEGLPMVLLEAMACSRAVVATRVGAIPHVIRHRVNGLVVSPRDANALADALLELLKCKEYCSALGRAAHDTIETHFSAGSMARQYLQMYHEILL